MDVTAKVIKLKPNSKQHIRDWAETLNKRKKEALETLREEGVNVESWFMFSHDGNDYMIAYMRCESISKAATIAKSSTHSIDEYHQHIKQATWDRENIYDAELLVDLIDD